MAKKKSGSVSAEVSALVRPIVESLGLELWDVRYLKEGANRILRIYIDSENGVTIEDCENVTRAVDAPLDELDPIAESYTLEVSSPGIERELVRDEHFDRFLGAPVMIKLIRPDENGERELKGTLIANEGGSITIRREDASESVIIKKEPSDLFHRCIT